MSRLSHIWRRSRASVRLRRPGHFLLLAQEKVTKENGLKIQPSLALSPAMQFFDRTSMSCRKTAVVLTAALRVYDVFGRSSFMSFGDLSPAPEF